MELSNGSTVAIIGGGPAGSFTAYFMLKMSQLLNVDLKIDIYEPKDFSSVGAKGCNHCGGVISESLIQFLATEGIHIPFDIIMNTIDSYVLHTEFGRVNLMTPLKEMRIATIFRGGGPTQTLGHEKILVRSFDGFLLELAGQKGARIIQERVIQTGWHGDRPQVVTKEGRVATYDLLVGATGVNGTGTKLYKNLNIGYEPPGESKTFINDFYLGTDMVEQYIGNKMHIFLLDIPGIQQGAIIPKGPFVTVCFVAEKVDELLIEAFYNHDEVKKCLPFDWRRAPNRKTCICLPSTNVKDPVAYYSDRVVFVGDCGVARLYKDGIGSAYRMAKACATTSVLWGISKTHFQEHYKPACQKISRDNQAGHLVLGGFSLARTRRAICATILAIASSEQGLKGEKRIMSMALWDAFSGSVSYRYIFVRSLSSPVFLLRFLGELLIQGWYALSRVKSFFSTTR